MARVERLPMNETKETIKGIKVVALDFDNNIVLNLKTRKGSEEAKKDAWYGVFPQYNKDELKIAIEKANIAVQGGKGDRRGVVRLINRDFGFETDEAEVDEYCKLFDDVVQKAIKVIGVPDEHRYAIKILSNTTNLYVCTATPLEAITESLVGLGIIDLFKDVYGRKLNEEKDKKDFLKEIIEREGVSPSELLMVGDSTGDKKAALAVGCKFIGMDTAGNTEWRQNKQPFPIIYSLKELVDNTNLVNYETK